MTTFKNKMAFERFVHIIVVYLAVNSHLLTGAMLPCPGKDDMDTSATICRGFLRQDGSMAAGQLSESQGSTIYHSEGSMQGVESSRGYDGRIITCIPLFPGNKTCSRLRNGTEFGFGCPFGYYGESCQLSWDLALYFFRKGLTISSSLSNFAPSKELHLAPTKNEANDVPIGYDPVEKMFYYVTNEDLYAERWNGSWEKVRHLAGYFYDLHGGGLAVDYLNRWLYVGYTGEGAIKRYPLPSVATEEVSCLIPKVAAVNGPYRLQISIRYSMLYWVDSLGVKRCESSSGHIESVSHFTERLTDFRDVSLAIDDMTGSVFWFLGLQNAENLKMIFTVEMGSTSSSIVWEGEDLGYMTMAAYAGWLILHDSKSDLLRYKAILPLCATSTSTAPSTAPGDETNDWTPAGSGKINNLVTKILPIYSVP